MIMRVALTIDAEHPDNPTVDPIGNAERILDLLRAGQVRATFFVQSSWAGAYPQLVGRMVEDGHLVGSHSHWHCIYTSMSHDGIVDDLDRSRAGLAAVGVSPGDLFRLPGGQGSTDPEILAALSVGGFTHVGWTMICGDWSPNWSVPQVVDAIMADGERHEFDGLSVPVVHSWSDVTPPALEQVVSRLARAGEDHD